MVAPLFGACDATKEGPRSEVQGPRDSASAGVDSGTPSSVPRTSTEGTPRASDPRPRTSVLIVGTSLTAGLGLDPEDAYPALLQRKADSAGYAATVTNAGISGETSAGALRRIDWLLKDPFDVMLLETGANDGLRGLDVNATRENIRAIIAKAKAARPGARIILVQMEAPPNMGERYTSSFRAMFPAVAKDEGVTLMPFLLTDVAGEAKYNQGDGIHPNEEGSKVVAANVWRVLEPVLRTKK